MAFWMWRCLHSLVLLLLTICDIATAEKSTVTVHTSTLLHKTLPQYASFDMDWWHNTTGSGGNWGNASILYADLTNTRLNAVVKALSPAFLRIGGSQDNIVKYQIGGMSAAECNSPSPFRGTEVSLCLTMERWSEVLEFVTRNGLTLVFGTSFFTDKAGKWNQTNVEVPHPRTMQ